MTNPNVNISPNHKEMSASIMQIYHDASIEQIANYKQSLLCFMYRALEYETIYWVHTQVDDFSLTDVFKIQKQDHFMPMRDLSKKEQFLLKDLVNKQEVNSYSYPIYDSRDTHKTINLRLYRSKLIESDNKEVICCGIELKTHSLIDYICLVRNKKSPNISITQLNQFIVLILHATQAYYIHLRFFLLTKYPACNRLSLDAAVINFQGTVLAQTRDFTKLVQMEWPDWNGDWFPISGNNQNVDEAHVGNKIVFVRRRIAGLLIIEARTCQREKLLTPRERQVTKYLLQGLSYKQIAKKLNISPFTITKHVNRIYKKLSVENKVQLINHYKQYQF